MESLYRPHRPPAVLSVGPSTPINAHGRPEFYGNIRTNFFKELKIA